MTFGQFRIIASVTSFAFFGGIYLPGGWTIPSFSWGDPPVSILASKCERLWIDEARNDPALECYLTSQTDRLCRASEKQHILWFIRHYQESRAKFEGKLWGYVTAVGVGMTVPPSPGKDGKRDGVVDHFNKITGEQAARLKQDAAFVKAMKMPSRIDSDLTAMVRKLAAKGLLDEGDFGWTSPSWVTDAFSDDLKVTPVCKQPTA